MPDDEVLIVAGGDRVAALGRWSVIAEVPPDVVVLRADPGDLREIANHTRLAMVRLPDGGLHMLGDEGALDELDNGARLFVTAWRERPVTKPNRLGEGLSWDAPGFEPPGSPRRDPFTF